MRVPSGAGGTEWPAAARCGGRSRTSSGGPWVVPLGRPARRRRRRTHTRGRRGRMRRWSEPVSPTARRAAFTRVVNADSPTKRSPHTESSNSVLVTERDLDVPARIRRADRTPAARGAPPHRGTAPRSERCRPRSRRTQSACHQVPRRRRRRQPSLRPAPRHLVTGRVPFVRDTTSPAARFADRATHDDASGPGPASYSLVALPTRRTHHARTRSGPTDTSQDLDVENVGDQIGVGVGPGPLR